MTVLRVCFAYYGRGWYSLRALGHAGEAAGGANLVCAACSALVFALADWLLNDPGCHVQELRTCSLLEGDATLMAQGDGHLETAFELARLGLSHIAREYPELVEVRCTKIAE